MDNSRTCKTCGAQTTTREKFTNISLDVVPGASIEEMLKAYQSEEDLECSCQCGGKISGRKSSLDTLPGFLIVHLKRFRFTEAYTLEKVIDPVQIQRDMLVSSNQGGGCYSLVSAISHYGNICRGHYIADAIHPDSCSETQIDRWLTLNDFLVKETVGSSVRPGENVETLPPTIITIIAPAVLRSTPWRGILCNNHHIKPMVCRALDPLQFVYQKKMGVEDASLNPLH
ncbi:probable ubiquitin carboxyl-terminal hydrolase 4 [Mugil cephalus]|uniref:probable ubiquitin carboxyl-terminal hydrolase 4 n=1 Tax=Mugil cephalus TaxID=48193 RepID=UPI001FB7925D|nr:probable ubiquitin carboxyl-terminal hydrolase 4 [Mugil cephalus]